jgi:hypothetical protein
VVTGLVAGTTVSPETEWGSLAHHDDVGLVLAFLNTVDLDEGTDVLDHPEQWRAWLIDHAPHLDGGGGRNSRSTDVDPAKARALREAMRTAVTDRQRHPDTAFGGLVLVELRAGVPMLVAVDALGAVLAASARLAVRGLWGRVKICPAHGCGWAFFDNSRNRSRTWCSMRVCGNRTKARNWRKKRARALAP